MQVTLLGRRISLQSRLALHYRPRLSYVSWWIYGVMLCVRLILRFRLSEGGIQVWKTRLSIIHAFTLNLHFTLVLHPLTLIKEINVAKIRSFERAASRVESHFHKSLCQRCVMTVTRRWYEIRHKEIIDVLFRSLKGKRALRLLYDLFHYHREVAPSSLLLCLWLLLILGVFVDAH